ncbi:M20/M25/M40 family metallo-hydrolase [Candidatus Moduliflexota bacterium]
MKGAFFSLTLLSLSLPLSAHSEYLRHDLKIVISPPGHSLKATDTVTLPDEIAGEETVTIPFVLHDGLAPRSETEGVSVAPSGDRYEVTLPAGLRTFTIAYEGVINHPLESVGEEYARGQQRSDGQIGPEGVFLSGSSLWHPRFDVDLMTFTLSVDLPPSWEAVSQGSRIDRSRDKGGTSVTWKADQPQNEIYLVAGPFTEYLRSAPGIEAMVFLRQPDDALAGRYLDATVQYVSMYSKLLGPYPYGKFALVENFWETGYGMPSFTLLGPKVVRFPFILHSSYPHEILHNWWGNSVFIDYEKGNWGEGLTAYLSDHLVKEQRGQGSEHRRTVLQKYNDYVTVGRDLPLRAFRGRHGSVSEAVGYGKTLMLFHMLRRSLGDDLFTLALREFYGSYRFRTASFSDLRSSFEKTSGRSLEAFFRQWVEEPGAPILHLEDVERSEVDGVHFLRGTIVQSPDGKAPFFIDVPLAVTVEGRDEALVSDISIEGLRTPFEIRLPARPSRIDVDPQFDVFRRLHLGELPPALTKAFGAADAVILLPSSAAPEVVEMYRELASYLTRTGPGEVTVDNDGAFKELPSDRSVWLLGWESRFLPDFLQSLSNYDINIGEGDLRIGRTVLPRKDHSFVLTARHRDNPDSALLWIGSDNPAAMAGLGRKLPHYHKYSYLAFEGGEPANVIKGRWPVTGSPLTYIFSGPGDERAAATPRGRLLEGRALAELEPLFSGAGMMETVAFLADPQREGRGLGSEGLEASAAYIARSFESAGLLPGGDGGSSWFQTWSEESTALSGGVTLRNIVGFLRGTNPDFAGQSIVVGAHYDHLGMGNAPGGADVRSGNEGKLHPGADDNASGVAVLLELARILGNGWKPERDVFFVAFTGEESEKIGSRRFVDGGGTFKISGCRAMINLDTVGRLGGGKLFVLGGTSAKEWVHIFRGAGYLTGVDIEMVAEELDASDQTCFLEKGVPAVQLFTGPHLDYHRPADLPAAVDEEGLVKVASVAREALEYLAAREEPLTASGASPSGKGAGGGPSRKTSLGTIPDFAYPGEGVRLDGVVPGSPAERAGLLTGDVLLAIDETVIGNLRDLSGILKSLSPGARVKLTYSRGGERRSVVAVLEHR